MAGGQRDILQRHLSVCKYLKKASSPPSFQVSAFDHVRLVIPLKTRFRVLHHHPYLMFVLACARLNMQIQLNINTLVARLFFFSL